MEHISFEDLKSRATSPSRFIAIRERTPFMPYTSGPSATPSGKIEFYSQSLAAHGPRSSSCLCPSHRIALGRTMRTAFRSSSWAARPTTT